MIDIRGYEPRDRDQFASLVADTLEEFGFRIDPILESDLNDPQARYSSIWVATDQGQVVGSAAIRRLDDGTAELKRMYLRPSHRGRGLGRALLETAVGWARDRECGSVVLDTAETMNDAQRLYEAAGFRRSGTRTERGADDARCEILYTLEF